MKLRNPFAKKEKIVKGKFDINYILDPNSALDCHIDQFGIFQDWIAMKLPDLVRNDSIIFDIGANIGLLTLPFARHIHNGMIYAFEPDIENFLQLERNVVINNFNNVKVNNLALQDDHNAEKLTFYKRRAIDGDKKVNKGISSLENMSIHNIAQISVLCSTIDRFVLENHIPKIDFIKTDVEGSEHKVLKGGIESITKNLPLILYEYSTTIDNLANSRNTYESFQFLKNLGYKQFQIFKEEKLIEVKEYDKDLDNVNILAFHSSKVSKYEISKL